LTALFYCSVRVRVLKALALVRLRNAHWPNAKGERARPPAATWQGIKNMATGSDITIRVVVFKDNDMWAAQCLEYDIGAQADDIDTLNERLNVVLNAELKESIERHKKPFAGIGPAPQRFQMMWEHRVRSVEITPPPWIGDKAKLDYALVA
jgi:hypothetical protein